MNEGKRFPLIYFVRVYLCFKYFFNMCMYDIVGSTCFNSINLITNSRLNYKNIIFWQHAFNRWLTTSF